MDDLEPLLRPSCRKSIVALFAASVRSPTSTGEALSRLANCEEVLQYGAVGVSLNRPAVGGGWVSLAWSKAADSWAVQECDSMWRLLRRFHVKHQAAQARLSGTNAARTQRFFITAKSTARKARGNAPLFDSQRSSSNTAHGSLQQGSNAGQSSRRGTVTTRETSSFEEDHQRWPSDLIEEAAEALASIMGSPPVHAADGASPRGTPAAASAKATRIAVERHRGTSADRRSRPSTPFGDSSAAHAIDYAQAHRSGSPQDQKQGSRFDAESEDFLDLIFFVLCGLGLLLCPGVHPSLIAAIARVTTRLDFEHVTPSSMPVGRPAQAQSDGYAALRGLSPRGPATFSFLQRKAVFSALLRAAERSFLAFGECARVEWHLSAIDAGVIESVVGSDASPSHDASARYAEAQQDQQRQIHGTSAEMIEAMQAKMEAYTGPFDDGALKFHTAASRPSVRKLFRLLVDFAAYPPRGLIGSLNTAPTPAPSGDGGLFLTLGYQVEFLPGGAVASPEIVAGERLQETDGSTVQTAPHLLAPALHRLRTGTNAITDDEGVPVVDYGPTTGPSALQIVSGTSSKSDAVTHHQKSSPSSRPQTAPLHQRPCGSGITIDDRVGLVQKPWLTPVRHPKTFQRTGEEYDSKRDMSAKLSPARALFRSQYAENEPGGSAAETPAIRPASASPAHGARSQVSTGRPREAKDDDEKDGQEAGQEDEWFRANRVDGVSLSVAPGAAPHRPPSVVAKLHPQFALKLRLHPWQLHKARAPGARSGTIEATRVEIIPSRVSRSQRPAPRNSPSPDRDHIAGDSTLHEKQHEVEVGGKHTCARSAQSDIAAGIALEVKETLDATHEVLRSPEEVELMTARTVSPRPLMSGRSPQSQNPNRNQNNATATSSTPKNTATPTSAVTAEVRSIMREGSMGEATESPSRPQSAVCGTGRVSLLTPRSRPPSAARLTPLGHPSSPTTYSAGGRDMSVLHPKSIQGSGGDLRPLARSPKVPVPLSPSLRATPQATLGSPTGQTRDHAFDQRERQHDSSRGSFDRPSSAMSSRSEAQALHQQLSLGSGAFRVAAASLAPADVHRVEIGSPAKYSAKTSSKPEESAAPRTSSHPTSGNDSKDQRSAGEHHIVNTAGSPQRLQPQHQQDQQQTPHHAVDQQYSAHVRDEASSSLHDRTYAEVGCPAEHEHYGVALVHRLDAQKRQHAEDVEVDRLTHRQQPITALPGHRRKVLARVAHVPAKVDRRKPRSTKELSDQRDFGVVMSRANRTEDELRALAAVFPQFRHPVRTVGSDAVRPPHPKFR